MYNYSKLSVRQEIHNLGLIKKQCKAKFLVFLTTKFRGITLMILDADMLWLDMWNE